MGCLYAYRCYETGAPGGIQTPDPLIRRYLAICAVLSCLEYSMNCVQLSTLLLLTECMCLCGTCAHCSR